MRSLPYKKLIASAAFLFTLMLVMPSDAFAQRMRHSASRGGASASRAKAPSRSQSPSRSASNRKASTSRPSSSRQASTRQASTRPSSSNRKSINGGHQKSSNRKVSAPSNTNRKTTSRETNRSTNRSTDRSTDRTANRDVKRDGSRDVKRDGNRDGNRGSGDRGSGNRVNVDKSRGDVNVNINNSRNTRVVASSRAYVRPPYRYGGWGYYCHRPYFYHPYRPFYWGPMWHPWGWFAATIATTAIIVSISDNDQRDDNQVYYDQGVYYVKKDGGYEVIQAPVGATVESLPKETEKVKVDDTTNNYYYGGAYYEKDEMGYTVVPATAGTIVPHLPEGGEEVKIGDVTYVQFGETYYQPIQVDGQDMYEIVEVREEE